MTCCLEEAKCTNIDGKLVDFNDMVIVIVKCFDYNWMNGSESD